ncbi:MAG: 2-C-methyl-D-erythritol 4-phosphate cytidylyltransferase [Spirochaetes bacterium GWF1_51_8]|nr:MAG: 2-C-methyl-D-erythritol 4-phosphate cytidylyltransferase [Spirochaetes bacterium GWF1_51_8]
MPEYKTAGIILAGGTGSRFGSDIPKQFLELCHKRVIEYSIDKFLNLVDFLVIVSHTDWLDFLSFEIIKDRDIRAVIGGDTRQMSVYNGLCVLEKENPRVVAIHDAARPLFSEDLLKRCIDTALTGGAAIAGITSNDSLAREGDGSILHYIDRETAIRIQTPQAFRYGDLYAAHLGARLHGKNDYTDDSQVVFATGTTVKIVKGEETNIKITSPVDLKIAEAILTLSD